MRRRERGTLGRVASRLLIVGTLSSALGLLAMRPAQADPPRFSLTWDGPAECPNADYVKEQVALLLEGAPPSPSRLVARAVVSQGADWTWTVRLATDRDGASGERTITAESCLSLADATALVVALTIDPTHVASPLPKQPSPPVLTDIPRPAPPPVLPRPAPRRSEPPRAREAVHFAVFPSVGFDLGTLPNAAYGFSVAGALLYGSFRAELYAEVWPYQTETQVQPEGKIELFDGGARGCYVPLRVPILELGPCGGAELGALHGVGLNLSNPSYPTGLWAALTLDARLVIHLTKALHLGLDAGAVFPLALDDFTRSGTSIQPWRVEARAHGGPELRF
jgi:hypothetical protein